jgi:hypothetical protein
MKKKKKRCRATNKCSVHILPEENGRQLFSDKKMFEKIEYKTKRIAVCFLI